MIYKQWAVIVCNRTYAHPTQPNRDKRSASGYQTACVPSLQPLTERTVSAVPIQHKTTYLVSLSDCLSTKDHLASSLIQKGVYPA